MIKKTKKVTLKKKSNVTKVKLNPTLNKFHRIEIPIYKCDLFIYMGKDTVSFKKKSITAIEKDYPGFFNMMEDEIEVGQSLGITFYRGKTICIHINYDEPSYNAINTIAHEIYHAVYKILNYSGLDVHETSEEAFSYLTGYITEEIFKALKIKLNF